MAHAGFWKRAIAFLIAMAIGVVGSLRFEPVEEWPPLSLDEVTVQAAEDMEGELVCEKGYDLLYAKFPALARDGDDRVRDEIERMRGFYPETDPARPHDLLYREKCVRRHK